MKLLNLLALITIFSTTTTFAFECKSISPDDIVVSLPFKNQSVSNGKYEDGICFPYKLNQTPAKKIVCELSQFESGWLMYFENGLKLDSSSALQQNFKGDSTIIITNKGESKIISNNVFQIHVDDNEVVAFHHDKSEEESSIQPQATCRYEDEK